MTKICNKIRVIVSGRKDNKRVITIGTGKGTEYEWSQDLSTRDPSYLHLSTTPDHKNFLVTIKYDQAHFLRVCWKSEK